MSANKKFVYSFFRIANGTDKGIKRVPFIEVYRYYN